jgi:hypothetical protein
MENLFGSSRPFRIPLMTRPLRASPFGLDGRQQRIDGSHLQPIALPQAVSHRANDSSDGFPRHACSYGLACGRTRLAAFFT